MCQAAKVLHTRNMPCPAEQFKQIRLLCGCLPVNQYTLLDCSNSTASAVVDEHTQHNSGGLLLQWIVALWVLYMRASKNLKQASTFRQVNVTLCLCMHHAESVVAHPAFVCRFLRRMCARLAWRRRLSCSGRPTRKQHWLPARV